MTLTVAEIIKNWDSFTLEDQAYYIGEYGADMVRRLNIPYDKFPHQLQGVLEIHCPSLVLGVRAEELDPFQWAILSAASEDELNDLSEGNSTY